MQSDNTLTSANFSQHLTLLFLHGFMGSERDWDEIISLIKDRARCLAVDLPGHGQHLGAPEERYTLEGTARWLLDVLDHQNTQSCIPVGYSMGGRLVFYLLINYPERFSGGIVISASPGLKSIKDRTLRQKWEKETCQKLLDQPFELFLNQWYAQPLFGDLKDRASTSFWQNRRQNDPKELVQVLQGLGTGRQPSFWESLNEVQLPILYMVGENDTKYCAIARQLYEYNSITIRLIPDCAHSVHLQHPQNVVEHIKSFIYKTGGHV